MTTLDEECLHDVVGDSREELDLDLEALVGENLAGHMAALDDSLSRQGAQVDVELERHLADILDKEVSRLALVVSNLAVVKAVSVQTE